MLEDDAKLKAAAASGNNTCAKRESSVRVAAQAVTSDSRAASTVEKSSRHSQSPWMPAQCCRHTRSGGNYAATEWIYTCNNTCSTAEQSC